MFCLIFLGSACTPQHRGTAKSLSTVTGIALQRSHVMRKLVFDLGGTKIALAAIDQGRMVDRAQIATIDAGSTIEEIVRSIATLAKDLQFETRLTFECIAGAGPGPVNLTEDTLGPCPNISPWQEAYPLASHLSELLEMPAVVDNDAALAALGDKRHGASKDCRNCIICTVSTGVGMGLFLNEERYQGDDGAAGEGGHMQHLIGRGHLCGCGGYGCMETFVSGTSIARRALELTLEGRYDLAEFWALDEELLINRGTPEATAENVAAAARRGSIPAQMLYNDMADVMGVGLANMRNWFNCGIVLVGSLTKSHDLWLERAVQIADNRCLPINRGKPIVVSPLGDDVVLWGASALADQTFGQKT